LGRPAATRPEPQNPTRFLAFPSPDGGADECGVPRRANGEERPQTAIDMHRRRASPRGGFELRLEARSVALPSFS